MDPINSVEFIRNKLERNRGQWKRISDESGVPYKTIKNFMQGRVKYPRLPVLDKLQTYFQQEANV